LQFRYACGNAAGGGPFILSMDGQQIGAFTSVNSTGNWKTWASKNIQNLALKSGKQTLRIYFSNGELNLGKFTFTYVAPLPYSQPIAEAGENTLVQLPINSVSLDASKSSNPAGGALTYTWKQIYGPSILSVTNANSTKPCT
jgi:hypothetical protein